MTLIHIKLFLSSLICSTWLKQAAADDNVTMTPMPVVVVQTEQQLANAVNDFGYKLLIEMMHQNKDNNIVISPASIAGLLAMTLLGSVGNTYEELAKTLGFSQDILANRNIHEEFGNILQRLNSNDTISRTLYADGIFVAAHTKLRETFRNYLSRVYKGDSHSVDFRHEAEVKEMINEWVKSHTEGNIENFLKQSLPESTKVVLLSALYFIGQWAQPFIPTNTMKMPFKKPSNEVMADLMLNFGQFDYVFSKEEGMHMIALPYNDSITTMYALKPRLPKEKSLLELMEHIDYSKIDSLIKQMTNKETVVRFPKMKLQSNINLKEAMKAVGVKSIFTPGEANFALMVDGNTIVNKTEEELITRITGDRDESKRFQEILNSLSNPGVYVDSVIHDVKITIDEFGTEAVAATAGFLARSSELFYADSPFYIFIRNEKTKLVTFSAVIFDPTV